MYGVRPRVVGSTRVDGLLNLRKRELNYLLGKVAPNLTSTRSLTRTLWVNKTLKVLVTKYC